MNDDSAPVKPDDLSEADRHLYDWMSLRGNDLCTEAGIVFRQRHKLVNDFFLFVGFLAQDTDRKRFQLAQALIEAGDDSSVVARHALDASKKPTMKHLRSFNSYQSEILIIRLADNFQCFLADLMQLCMHKQPNIIKSTETITTEEALNFRSIKELTRFLVNKKLSSLSYAGLDNVLAFFGKQLGLVFELSPDETSRLKVAVELRNVYTHSRGKIDRVFLGRVGRVSWHNFVEGQECHLSFEEITTMAANMQKIAIRLDEAAAKKFSLPRKKVATWLKPKSAGGKRASL